MTRLSPLEPMFFLSDFEPENAVYLTCADAAAALWLPNGPGVLDGMASAGRTVLGTMGRFLHRAAVSPASARLSEWAGLHDPTRHVFYDANTDCLALAETLSRDGATILCQHYTPRWRDYAISWRTPPAVLCDLNNKANLPNFVPPEFAPRRRLVKAAALLDEIEKEPAPMTLKVGTPLSTGGGYAASVCPTADAARATARSFLDAHDPDACYIIESFYPFTRTWCANVGVYESGRRYFGAAQQILNDARKQTGSYNGGPFTAPDGVRDASLAVAENAFNAGYRGIAGMDIGLTEDGELIVFDLNFRQNACTSQVMYHDSACARIGAAVSRDCSFTFTQPLAEIAEKVAPLIKQGVFACLESFDKELHETAGAGCTIGGLTLGRDVDEADAVAETIASL